MLTHSGSSLTSIRVCDGGLAADKFTIAVEMAN
jgi:hypothetical protein